MMKMCGCAESAALIALSLGYIVCHMAKNENKAMKTMGYVIGAFVITLSALHIITSAVLSSKMCPMGKKMGTAMPHHQMMKSETPPMPTAGQQK